MSALLGVLIIIILAVPMAFLLKRRIEDTFFAAFSVVSLVLYIFGILEHLTVGVYAVCAIAVLGIVVLVLYIFTNKQNKSASLDRLKKYALTSGLFVFMALGIFFALLNIGRMYYLNDEFSHWGLSIKNMFALDTLAVAPESSATFKDYPPYATLICYFFSAVTGSYSESLTFTGMALLMFSCIMPLFNIFAEIKTDNNLSKSKNLLNKYSIVPLAVSVCFVFVMFFKLSAFTILAVDTLLGLIPVYILGIYYAERNKNKHFLPCVSIWVLICLAMTALTLTKGTGWSIALYTGIIILIDIVFICRRRGACSRASIVGAGAACEHAQCECTEAPQPSKWPRLWCRLACGILPLLAASAAKLSWSKVMTANGVVNDSVGFKETVKRAYYILIDNSSLLPGQQTIVENFRKATFEGRFSVGISLATIVLVLALLSVLLIVLVRKDCLKRNSYIWLFVGTIAAFMLYMAGILYTYVYVFTAYEGETLASYERYTGTFITMWLCLLLMLYVDEFFENVLNRLIAYKWANISSKIVSIISIACIVVFFFGFYPYSAKESVEYRKKYDADGVIGELYDAVSADGTKANDVKICFVTETEENRERYIANYYAAPFVLDFSGDLPKNPEIYSYVYIDGDDILYRVEIKDGISELVEV